MKEKKRFIHGSIFVEKKGKEKNGSEKEKIKVHHLFSLRDHFCRTALMWENKKMIDNTNF